MTDTLTKQHFLDRFPHPSEFEDATAGVIGSAIVLHIKQVKQGKFVPREVVRDIEASYAEAQIGLSDDARLALSEGMNWARQVGLVVVDMGNYGSSEWCLLSRSGKSFTMEAVSAIRLRNLLPDFMLHPTIRAACLAIFNTGKFDAAVFEAFRTIEEAIRDAAGYDQHEYGTPMIGRAFNDEQGPLRDGRLSAGERQSMHRLMMGAHGLLKNPRSHRSLGLDDPTEAAEMLVIASHLMRVVDDRAQAVKGRAAATAIAVELAPQKGSAGTPALSAAAPSE